MLCQEADLQEADACVGKGLHSCALNPACCRTHIPLLQGCRPRWTASWSSLPPAGLGCACTNAREQRELLATQRKARGTATDTTARVGQNRSRIAGWARCWHRQTYAELSKRSASCQASSACKHIAAEVVTSLWGAWWLERHRGDIPGAPWLQSGHAKARSDRASLQSRCCGAAGARCNDATIRAAEVGPTALQSPRLCESAFSFCRACNRLFLPHCPDRHQSWQPRQCARRRASSPAPSAPR